MHRPGFRFLPALAVVAVCAGAAPGAPRSSARAQGPDAVAERVAQQYARGEYVAVRESILKVADLRAFGREIERRTPDWNDRPGRRPLLFLEIAAAAFDRGTPEALEEGKRLLEIGCAALRRAAPTPFEQQWHVAAIGLLHHILDPAAAEAHIAHARPRFLGEPTFVLARAVAQDQRTSPFALNPPGTAFEEAIDRYNLATASPTTVAEARTRQAYVHYRLARYQEAAKLLDGTDTNVGDTRLLYWIRLFRGRVLEAQRQPDAAARAYRAAFDVAPGAQSPTVALAALALRAGDRAEAARLAASLSAGQADVWDPWWDYWYGDYRFVGPIVASLRKAVR